MQARRPRSDLQARGGVQGIWRGGEKKKTNLRQQKEAWAVFVPLQTHILSLPLRVHIRAEREGRGTGRLAA